MTYMYIQELIDSLVNYHCLTEAFFTGEIFSVVNDSREANDSSAFIAIRGEHFDGHQAVDELIQKRIPLIILEEATEEQIKEARFNGTCLVKVISTDRAQAILASRFYDQPSEKLDIIAVTGTNGKTTISNMISYMLEVLGHTTGMIGTIHYKVADQYFPAVNTTPNSLKMQKLFSEMLDAGCQDAVIEASSHALVLGRLWQTQVDCAIFTNLTREHLDFHKTMDNYANAKSLLFAQLGQSFKNHKAKLAIVNQDDHYAKVMYQATGAALATYSMIDPSATAYADDIQSSNGIMNFSLHYKGERYPVSLNMLGHYNVMNYMAAFLCLKLYYGYSATDILQATQQFPGVSGRMQVINEGQPYTVVVDFAHTGDALQKVIEELRPHTKGRLRVLFGHSGGNRDSAARPGLGDILFNYADEIYFTADNPRHEPVDKIVSEMVADHDEVPYHLIEKREEAIEKMLLDANDDDVLLFAGKGGESYQVLGDDYVPYNEAEVVIETIRRLMQK